MRLVGPIKRGWLRARMIERSDSESDTDMDNIETPPSSPGAASSINSAPVSTTLY